MTYLSKIVKLSEVVQDKHGLFHIDLELADGTVGYYPGDEKFLSMLEVGQEVTYLGTKHFNKRNKINGLNIVIHMSNITEKVDTIIVGVSGVEKNKGFYFRTLTTEDGVSAIHLSKQLADIESLIVGSRISYTDITNKNGKDVFVGLEKLKRYGADDRRQLSITRQSSVKAAIECLAIASPKGRWTDKDGNFQKEVCYKEVTELAELFVTYVSVE
jgi:hypothetical protein